MTKLDDILEQTEGYGSMSKGHVKQQIKDLFKELIGEDEDIDRIFVVNGSKASKLATIRNDLKAELRKKVDEL